MYKLYYDTIPGNKLLLNEFSRHVKGYRSGLWRETGVIHDMMSILGIKYKWTNNINDPKAIAIIEVDSPESKTLHKIIGIASKKFKKCIVVSTTEAPTFETISIIPDIKKQFPNVLLLFLGNPKLNFSSSNIIFYPFFLIKPFVFDMTVETHNFRDCNYLTSKKDYLFNHMSRMWSRDKYHTHYTIQKHLNRKYDGEKGYGALLSYRPINHSSRSGKKEDDIKNLSGMIVRNDMRIDGEKTGRYKKLYPSEDYLACADPNSPKCFPLKRLNDDPMYDDEGNMSGTVGMTKLKHPYTIYKNSHISLVTENGCCSWQSSYLAKGLGFDEKNPNPDAVCVHNRVPRTQLFNHVISEKTVQPILNGHIFIVGNVDMSNGKYHTNFLKKILGFQMFEEIFDYKSLENDSRHLFTYNIISQFNEFREEIIFDNAKILTEKIYHNRDLMINPSGELRQKLKKWFVEDILNKFLKLDP